MDYYQGIVAEYLDADRSVFLNSECYIQLMPGPNLPKGTTWYCDILAINLREKVAYMCEITFSEDLTRLVKRLAAWDREWPGVRAALHRDCSIPVGWPIKPWVFIPAGRWSVLQRKLKVESMPYPRVTYLEEIVPWKYSSDSRSEDIINHGA
jgi:hypothetical protein